ncbi:MAG TPA: DinB family protein [Candidatus Angelobacter sp.]|nr:DinB family protein [Candidatus Angelobacter sp.]
MDNGSASLQNELRDIRARAQALVDGLTAEELTRRPDPAKWSVAECLAHLNLTAVVVQRLISKGIERGRKEKLLGTGPFKLGTRGSLLIWIATPPPKFPIRAPRSVAPPVSIPDPGRLCQDFMKAQDEWAELWRQAEGLDLARINIGGFFSPFRCHMSASFPWMMAHQRRHLLQAEKVKRQILSAGSSSSTKPA